MCGSFSSAWNGVSLPEAKIRASKQACPVCLKYYHMTYKEYVAARIQEHDDRVNHEIVSKIIAR